jgi:hypothetical protein
MGEIKPGAGAVTLYLLKNEVLILTDKMSRISHTFLSVSYADSQKHLCLTAFFANKFDLSPYRYQKNEKKWEVVGCGGMWWDVGIGKWKVESGTSFQPAGNEK